MIIVAHESNVYTHNVEIHVLFIIDVEPYSSGVISTDVILINAFSHDSLCGMIRSCALV